MSKSEIIETIRQLKPIHWILIETHDGIKKRGKFMSFDKEFLYFQDQRVMGTGLIYEGKTGQIPQLSMTKIELSKLAKIERVTARGNAAGSKATRN